MLQFSLAPRHLPFRGQGISFLPSVRRYENSPCLEPLRISTCSFIQHSPYQSRGVACHNTFPSGSKDGDYCLAITLSLAETPCPGLGYSMRTVFLSTRDVFPLSLRLQSYYMGGICGGRFGIQVFSEQLDRCVNREIRENERRQRDANRQDLIDYRNPQFDSWSRSLSHTQCLL